MANFLPYSLLLASLGQLAAAQEGYGGGGPIPAAATFAAPTTNATTAAAGGKVGAQSGGGSPAHGGMAGPTTADLINLKYSTDLLLISAVVVGGLFFYRWLLQSIRYIRMLACLTSDRQLYFVRPTQLYAGIKKHIINAPLFRKRRSREFKLSAAVNVATLPTRFELMVIMGFLAANVAFCVLSIDFTMDQKTMLAILRNRTGILAVSNMLPLFLLAGRNNPLISLLNISFNTFNMVHRWTGRIVVLEAVTHMSCYMISKVKFSGWDALGLAIKNSNMILMGLLAATAFVFLAMHSPSMVRHAFYETFLHAHISLAIVAIFGVWIHIKELPQVMVIQNAVITWAVDRVIRFIILIYRNIGRERTTAIIEALPGDAVRVTVSMARPWTFKPGQHLYLYVPSVGLWTSHPFSVAWSEEEESLTSEKGLVMNRKDVLAAKKTNVSLIIRRRTGFTDKLYRRAENSSEGRMIVKCFAEGPYGAHHTLHSYGTVLLFAAGVGITHQVPYVRDLVAGYANGTVACRKAVLVWVIQSPEHLEWIRPWMTTILSMEKRRDVLKILLFVTRPRSTKEIHSPSATVQMFPGKPNVETLIDLEMETQIGAMGVSVCGTGSLSDDVRKAVRDRQTISNIDFVEESFSW